MSGFEVSTGWGWLDVGGLKLDMISFQFQTSISVIEMSFATLDNLSNLQKEINKDEALYFYHVYPRSPHSDEGLIPRANIFCIGSDP